MGSKKTMIMVACSASSQMTSSTSKGYLRVPSVRPGVSMNSTRGKFFSVEVENVLAAHPGVLESAIIGRPCPVLGERVHAFVTRRDPDLQAPALAAFSAERLADYKVPETFTLLDVPLPRNANGKLLKRALRDALSNEEGRP